MRHNFFITCICFLALTSCRKLTNGIEVGTYKGEFTVHYGDESRSGYTELTLRHKQFICQGNTNRIPATGAGSYKIEQDVIVFFDEFMRSSDFDGNLVLSGEYKYDSERKNLILTKTVNEVLYEYRLNKCL